jgi:hypothetical protein
MEYCSIETLCGLQPCVNFKKKTSSSDLHPNQVMDKATRTSEAYTEYNLGVYRSGTGGLVTGVRTHCDSFSLLSGLQPVCDGSFWLMGRIALPSVRVFDSVLCTLYILEGNM